MEECSALDFKFIDVNMNCSYQERNLLKDFQREVAEILVYIKPYKKKFW